MTVVTVTLNAAVDKTYVVPGFSLNHIHRPTEAKTTAGGKGINVARVLHTLGGDTLATGLLGGMNGRFLAGCLAEEGIPADFVPIAQESRVAIAVLDPTARTQTEINEVGPLVSAAEIATLEKKLQAHLAGASWLVLSGSVPPGVPVDIYAKFIRAAREHGVRVLLDTSGEPLAAAMGERPYIVKPNCLEVAALGISVRHWADAPAAAKELRGRFGVELALITGGAQGAVLAAPAGVWWGAAPAINLVSAVGSGDSLAAAFVWAIERAPADLAGALAWGMAAGAANAQGHGAGFCTKAQIEQLRGKIEVETV